MPDATQMAVAPDNRDQQEFAVDLATRLGLPLTAATSTSVPLLLVITAHRLELRQTGPLAPGPVYVDFLSGKADYRRRYGNSQDEAVVRAVTSKRNRTPKVLDATAGLGRDGFVLAAHGCRVVLVERHPVIAALLADGLRRAAQDEKVGPLVRKRMLLLTGDSLVIMRELRPAEQPEVVYLDPMYPRQDKRALVKKETQVLRMLAGPDQDGAALLQAALGCARQRVVVKRPVSAPPLAGRHPDLVRPGTAHRFDIYLVTPASVSQNSF